MSIKHKEIEILKDAPFENCKLGRVKYAKVLTNIVSTYSDGFVLAINSEWGSGKTTFIKMWQQHLVNEDFKTLYFNAWENDYDSNPLAALMAELKTLTPQSNAITFNSLLEKGAMFIKNTTPNLLKAIAIKYIGEGAIAEAIKDTSKAATEILKDEIEKHTKKKEGLIEFRKEVEKYISENNNGKPIVFIIDELDRCRPDYAVEVLELVKHFFNVSGIVFVLSIDKIQLSGAIKGFYGSAEINAFDYLRRFIDIEFVLPTPKYEDFCNYLYHYFKFDKYFDLPERLNYHALNYDKKLFLKFSSALFESRNLTLRQQEKIYANARIGLNLLLYNSYIFPSLYILLVYIRLFDYELFKKIKERKLKLQELVNEIRIYVTILDDEYRNNEMMLVEAQSLHFYNNNYKEKNNNSELYKSDVSTGGYVLLVSSGINIPNANEILLRNLRDLNNSDYNRFKMDTLLSAIEFTENIKV